jgi:hypothetical protein
MNEWIGGKDLEERVEMDRKIVTLIDWVDSSLWFIWR